jgi:hypothetical protein
VAATGGVVWPGRKPDTVNVCAAVEPAAPNRIASTRDALPGALSGSASGFAAAAGGAGAALEAAAELCAALDVGGGTLRVAPLACVGTSCSGLTFGAPAATASARRATNVGVRDSLGRPGAALLPVRIGGIDAMTVGPGDGVFDASGLGLAIAVPIPWCGVEGGSSSNIEGENPCTIQAQKNTAASTTSPRHTMVMLASRAFPAVGLSASADVADVIGPSGCRSRDRRRCMRQ